MARRMAVKDSPKKAKFGEGLGSFLLAVAAILAFRWALFEPYVIPSGSMIPTLLIHDHILVNKFAYGLRFPFTANPGCFAAPNLSAATSTSSVRSMMPAIL